MVTVFASACSSKVVSITNGEDQIDLYMQYLQDLRDVCRDKGVDFFSADRVFYIEDKKDKNNTVNGYGSAQKLKVNRELRQGFGIPSEKRKLKTQKPQIGNI